MAINIYHTLDISVEVYYYTKEGYTFRCRDDGQMDDVAERVSETLVKHNFSYANVCSVETGEVLMILERT